MWVLPLVPLLLSALYLRPLIAHACRTGLTRITESTCICPGQQLVLECTIAGSDIQFTVWRGSALDCSSGISLSHGRFTRSGYENSTCNNGAVLAQISSINGSCSISQLIVNTSLNLDGENIGCAYDDGTVETVVDTEIIRITTASFPPPIVIQLVDVQPQQITFNWTSVATLCQSLMYRIISFNCGECPYFTTSTTVTCTGVIVSENICTLNVQAVVCGNLIGNLSTPVSVILKVPRVSAFRSVPHYSHMTHGLLSIATSFDALDSFIISDGFQNHITSYSISYSDSTTGNICSQVAIIPATTCHHGVCTHIFEVSSSFCHPSTNITIHVLATSNLGPGAASDPLTISSRNNVFYLDTIFDADRLRITCTLINPVQTYHGERFCKVSFGLEEGKRCNNMSRSLTNQHNEAEVLQLSVDISSFSRISEIMCFVVIASDGRFTAEVERTFTINSGVSGCNPNDLGDNSVLSEGVQCGSPLFTTSIRNGLVCYTGTGIDSIATHYCFKCGVDSTVSSSTYPVRICLSNGTWSGTTPHCDCTVGTINAAAYYYAAISMGVVIFIIGLALITLIILLLKSKAKTQKVLSETKESEKMQIYEEINLSQVIDSKANVAYEVCPQKP